LVWTVAVFALAQTALPAVADLSRPGWQWPQLARKLDLLAASRVEHPDRPLLLAFGSSRTLNGLRADLLDGLPLSDGRLARAFNMGLTGAGPMRQLLLLERVLESGEKPDLVLIELLPGLFNEPGAGRISEEEWLDPAELSAVEVARLRHLHSRPDHLIGCWLRARLSAGIGRRHALLSAAGWVPAESEELMPVDAHGWQTFRNGGAAPDDRRMLTERSIRQFDAALNDFRPAPGSVQALAELLTLCREEHIPAVMVCMPESPTFRLAYRPEAERGLAKILAGAEATVIDARDWIGEDGFRDGHHLLPAAAASFTLRLRDELAQRIPDGNESR
jgi:hypothetical protein